MPDRLRRGYKGLRAPAIRVVDLGFPDLDKVLGNPCDTLYSVYGRTRQVVSDSLGVVGSALTGAGDAVSALGERVSEGGTDLQTGGSEG